MSTGGRQSAMVGRTLILAAVLIAASSASSPAHADVLKVGDRLAELDVATDANAKAFKLKAYRGKWVLVTVGAEWCKPCAKELPTWDKLAGELKGKITFVAIGIDDEAAASKRFHKKLKLKNMTLVYLPASKSGVVASYGSDTMPTTFIADKSGVVRVVKKGFEEGDTSGELKKMREQLEKLIK
jgi:thiol-disulfide isomerase/thioredoxin